MMIYERFNGEDGKKRSGPLPHDGVRWCDRPQRAISLPRLKCLENATEESPRVETAGDKLLAEKRAAGLIGYRSAHAPAGVDAGGRARAIGTVEVRTAKIGCRSVGAVRVQGKPRGKRGPMSAEQRQKLRDAWTPAKRRAEALRNKGNQNWRLRRKRRPLSQKD